MKLVSARFCIMVAVVSLQLVAAQETSFRPRHLRKKKKPPTTANNGKQKPYFRPPTTNNNGGGNTANVPPAPLIEMQSCVDFSSYNVQTAIQHPWSDASCQTSTNECSLGTYSSCCRLINNMYLKCDRYNNHPTMPCVCKNTNDSTTSNNSTSTTTDDGNNNGGTSSTIVTDYGNNTDFGGGAMPPYEGMNPPPGQDNNNTMAAICQNGSPYWDNINNNGTGQQQQLQRCTGDASCTDPSMCCDIDTCFCVPNTSSEISCVPPPYT